LVATEGKGSEREEFFTRDKPSMWAQKKRPGLERRPALKHSGKGKSRREGLWSKSSVTKTNEQ